MQNRTETGKSQIFNPLFRITFSADSVRSVELTSNAEVELIKNPEWITITALPEASVEFIEALQTFFSKEVANSNGLEINLVKEAVDSDCYETTDFKHDGTIVSSVYASYSDYKSGASPVRTSTCYPIEESTKNGFVALDIRFTDSSRYRVSLPTGSDLTVNRLKLYFKSEEAAADFVYSLKNHLSEQVLQKGSISSGVTGKKADAFLDLHCDETDSAIHSQFEEHLSKLKAEASMAITLDAYCENPWKVEVTV